jgi:aspartyl aminopeptidase
MATSVASSATAADCRARAEQLVQFFNTAVSNFHAVAEVKTRLVDAGFIELSERKEWPLERGGKYFFSRNGSAILAFAIGHKFQAGNGAFMVGAHTDSPCLKLKPVSRADSVGALEIAIQTYGGGLWSTWFDRDLGVAGRVLVRGEDGAITQRLVRIDKPICRIPMLAIHLSRDSGTKLEINPETDLKAVLCSSVAETLNIPPPSGGGADSEGAAAAAAAASGDGAPSHANRSHHAGLVHAVAREVGVTPEAIVDFELQLHDTQPAAIGGL